jgi:hypothetical protein
MGLRGPHAPLRGSARGVGRSRGQGGSHPVTQTTSPSRQRT